MPTDRRRWRTAMVAGVILGSLGTLPSAAEDFIRLLSPETFVVTEADPALQGMVDLPGLRKIEVIVEPFLPAPGETPRRYQWDVLSGSFQGRIRLFPGLNLVRLRSPGKQVMTVAGFYHPSADVSQKPWGTSTPVVLAEPRELRVTHPQVPVDGFLTTPGVTAVDVLALSSEHILLMRGGDGTGTRLTLRQAAVKDLRFQTTADLSVGDNILLIRPGAVPAAEVAVRSVFFEPENPRLSLDTPQTKEGRILVRGRAKKSGSRVRVKASGLVGGPRGTLTRRFFYDQEIISDTTGRFETQVSLGNLAEIKNFPLVEVWVGKDYAAKVLLDIGSTQR